MKRLRWPAISACLIVLLTDTPTASAADPPAAGSDPLTTGSVTLLTGDVVDILGDGHLSVRPAKGRERTGFLLQRRDGHQVVIPRDAMRLLAAGKVDRSLFDITTLLEAGYDDARRADIPLIVQYGAPSARTGTRAWLNRQHAAVTGDLGAINALSARTAKRDAGAWWAALTAGPALAGGVESIRLDGVRKLSLDESTTQIGVPAARRAGLTGRGVTVAVLDSGIDAGHPDFAGRIRENRDFTDAAEDGDLVGHGTHVASTIAGSGAASDGRYQGVAPDADLLVGKVCEDEFCRESAMLAGLQWAAERGADVVNLSIGGADTPGTDVLEEAVNRLSEQYGTLFVAAAGNDGESGASTVDSPSTAEAALSVAATTRGDDIAAFSGRGPRLTDGGTKPELSAPGVGIVAARSGQAGEPAEPVGERYQRLSGTSMATPHVTGAAALLAQQHTGWSGAQLKAALLATATDLAGADVSAQGAGRVDLGTAVTAPVLPDAGSLNLGVQEWPHGDDKPVVRTVTYRNDGAAPVTLKLAASLTGPGGAAAPAGMVTVAPVQTTVPAGGTAAVKVTVDTSVNAPDGRYTGRLTAVTPESTRPVTTLLSVVRDIERYALTVRVLDRRGADAVDYTSLVTSWADGSNVVESTPGAHTTRLPPGDYTVGGLVFTDPYAETETITLLAQPRLRLAGDTTIVLDARAGQAITATVPESTASFTHADIGYRVDAPEEAEDALMGWTNFRRGFDNLFTAQIGPSDSGARFRSDIAAGWARANADGGFPDSPYAYHLGWQTPGSLPTGLTRHVQPGEPAVVRSSYHGPKGKYGSAGAMAQGATGFVVSLDLRLPGERTDYYDGREGARWFQSFVQIDESQRTETVLTDSDVGYRAGRTYRASWNGAVLGPAFGARPAGSASGALRTADGRITVFDGLLVDPAAGRASEPKIRRDSARTALYRNGDLLAENNAGYGIVRAAVPPDAAAYRLEAEIDRASYADVSTKIAVAWTFQSRQQAAGVVLPLMSVRYAPVLDAGRTAPAGRPLQIPVRVEHQPGSTIAAVTGLTVQVSYDDGGTWQPAPVSGAGKDRVVAVTHPVGARHVSLRATATDSNGGKVEQTIMRAYLLG